MSVSNQKIVTINKAKSDKNNLYGIINIEAAQKASRTLKAGAFKLWTYFNLQQDGYKFELSSKHLRDTWGISKKQYDNGIHELIDNGYLIQEHESSNKYIFDEAGTLVSKGYKPLCPKDTRGEDNNAIIEIPLYQKDTTLVPKGYKGCTKREQGLSPLDTRNITDITDNTGYYIPSFSDETEGKSSHFDFIQEGMKNKKKVLIEDDEEDFAF